MTKEQPSSPTRSHAGYTDSERLDFLEQDVAEEPLCIHNLPVGEKVPCRGLGLKPTGRTLRQALDQIMSANGIKPSTPPSESVRIDPEILNAARRYQFLKQHHLGTLLSLVNTTDTSDTGLDFAVDRDMERCQW